MIILCMTMSAICALGLVHLFESGWVNRPPVMSVQWPKARAMRFMWAGAGILMVLGNIPLGIMLAIAGLPVCLAHLRLVDRDSAVRIRAMDVLSQLYQNGRETFRRFLDRTKIGPRQ